MTRTTLFAAVTAVFTMAIMTVSTASAAPVALAGIATKSAPTEGIAASKVHYRPYFHRHRWDPPYYDDWDDDYWYYRPCYWDSYIGRRVCVRDYGYNRRRARVRRSRRNRRRNNR